MRSVENLAKRRGWVRAVTTLPPRVLLALLRLQTWLTVAVGRRRKRRRDLAFFGSVRERARIPDPAAAILRDHVMERLVGRAALIRVAAAPAGLDDPLLCVTGMEHVDAVLAEGRGCVLAGAHIGTAGLPAAVLARQGHTVLTLRRKELEDRLDDEHGRLVFYGATPLWYGDDETAAALMKRCMKGLAENQVVSYLVDGVLGERGVVVEVLGVPVFLRTGAMELARIARAPIIPAFGNVHDDRVLVEFCQPWRISSQEDVEAFAHHYARLFADRVRRFPGNCTRRNMDQYIIQGRKAEFYAPR